jgi:hypothetical protein
MSDVVFELLGDDLAVDDALTDSALREFARIQRREEGCESSGLQVCLSGTDEDAGFQQQVTEAIRFLENEAAEIRRLRNFPGVRVARLRFGVFWHEDTAVKYSSLPSNLLLKCGELGLDIVICEYLCDAKWFPNLSQ